MHYFIGRCRANIEMRAKRQIERAGGEAVVPLIKGTTRRSGKAVKITRPLVSEYLFIKKKPKYSRYPKDWRYMTVAMKTAQVQENEVQRMVETCAALDKAKNVVHKPFRRGQRLEITSGYFGREIVKFCGYLRNGKRSRVLRNGYLLTLRSEQLKAAPE